MKDEIKRAVQARKIYKSEGTEREEKTKKKSRKSLGKVVIRNG